MLLPHEFWVPHGNPLWKGGVERALMSTTVDKSVALHYAGGKGTVVEIDVGRIQIGGEVAFLSMVPAVTPTPCILGTLAPGPRPASAPPKSTPTALPVPPFTTRERSCCLCRMPHIYHCSSASLTAAHHLFTAHLGYC
jgi:hypothetical protein